MDVQTIREKILPIVGIDPLRQRLLAGELERFRQTMALVTPHTGGRLLDVGACGDLVPVYRDVLRYTQVDCLDAAGSTGPQQRVHEDGTVYAFDSHRLNLERDPFPFPDATFDQVVAMEVLEHLAIDPMFMLAEANRVLKPGGRLVLTTPNINAMACVYRQLWGKHPAVGRQCFGPGTMDRHHREYAVDEVGELAEAAGFGVNLIDTFTPSPLSKPVRRIARMLGVLGALRPELRRVERGSVIRCAAVKVSEVAERFPEIVYPRYAFYDYAAYDRELADRFGGRRYWRTDAVPVLAQDAQNVAQNRDVGELQPV